MVNEKARLTLETSRRELEPGSGRRGSGNAELASGSETKTTTETTHIGTKVGHSVLSFAHVLLNAIALYRLCSYYINVYQYSVNLHITYITCSKMMIK